VDWGESHVVLVVVDCNVIAINLCILIKYIHMQEKLQKRYAQKVGRFVRTSIVRYSSIFLIKPEPRPASSLKDCLKSQTKRI
jgi:hypothetical protein